MTERVSAANKSLPVLPGWVILSAAAVELGVSRQYMFKQAEDGGLKTVHQIPGTGQRPAAIVMRRSELARMKQAREERVTCPECKALVARGETVEICVHHPEADAEVAADLEVALEA
jgi:hypothetical protein